METELVFTVDASLESVIKSAGIDMTGRTFAHCPLVVGDVISFPEAPALFFRVETRWLRAGSTTNPNPSSWPDQWVLVLEQTEAPIRRSATPSS